jgi:D-glycero-D-manno-heptose 1,7-bisphosphate phosphatase
MPERDPADALSGLTRPRLQEARLDEHSALTGARLMRETLSAKQLMARAVFLDRDGVLNRNVYYPDTQAWESPRTVDAVQLTPGIAPALAFLQAAGYLLIVVSNQPNAAKGKCSREALDLVHAQVVSLLAAEGVALDAHYLCLHHPEHTGPCECRKPSPFFLLNAAASYGINLDQSWMIGDRATDVECGRAAGTRTIWVDTGEGSAAPTPNNAPDFIAPDVPEAIAHLLELAVPSRAPAKHV